MSRRRAAEIREVNPDARYGSKDVAKFINCLMTRGKKSIVERALYKAFDEIAQKMGADAIQVFEEVLEKVRPLIEVRPKRVGGATYQVPFEVRSKRAKSLAFRWIIAAARARKDKKTLASKLAAEFMDAYAGRGAAIKKREDTHKMAEANRAFAHYVW